MIMNKSKKKTDIISFSSQFDSFYVDGKDKYIKDIRAYFMNKNKIQLTGAFELILSYLKYRQDVPLYMAVKELQTEYIIRKLDEVNVKECLRELLVNYLKKEKKK